MKQFLLIDTNNNVVKVTFGSVLTYLVMVNGEWEVAAIIPLGKIDIMLSALGHDKNTIDYICGRKTFAEYITSDIDLQQLNLL